MARSTTFDTHQESDCWLGPLRPCALIAFNGARGSVGWFDRGALDKRSARAVAVHDRSGAPGSAGGGLSVKV